MESDIATLIEIISTTLVIATAFLDPIGCIIIIYLLCHTKHKYYIQSLRWRIPAVLIVGGLLAQTYRSFYTLVTGRSPQDMEMVFWVFKDFGIVLVCLVVVTEGLYSRIQHYMKT